MKRIPWIVVIVAFMVVCASFSFAADPKACVKNNAGVVLKINQPCSPGVHGDIIALGQSTRVYTSCVVYLLCATMFGEYTTCEWDYKDKGIYLQDGQTLELTGTVFRLSTHITDNTCK